MIYLRIIIVAAFLFISSTRSFSQLWIGSEFRPRIEYRDGYRLNADSKGEPAFLASFRTRIHISYRLSKFSFGFLPQDTRTLNDQQFLENTGMDIPNTGLNLREAWISYSPDERITFKIGRQVAFFNDQRLMAKRNWSQDGTGYDMIGFEYHKNNIDLQTGISYNFFPEKSTGDDYTDTDFKTFNFINLKGRYANKLEIAFVSVLTGKNDIDSVDGIFFQNTSGIYTEYSGKKYGIHASFYTQWGRNHPEEKVFSYLTDIHGLAHFGKSTLSSGLAIISGNRRSDNRHIDHTFDLLYGVRHSYYGLMDHFSETDESTNNSGLIDGYLSVVIQNSEKLNFELGLHALSMAGDYYRTDPQFVSLGKYLATETDFIALYQWTSWLMVEAGYCILIPSGTYRHFVSTDAFRSSNFAYLMITFSPVLLD